MKKLFVYLLLFLFIFSSITFPKPVNATAEATGGTYTEAGGYGTHTFTASGTFTPSHSMTAEVLVVGGGGGGGYNSSTYTNSWGGGGGGQVTYNASVSFAAQGYAVTVGPSVAREVVGNDSSVNSVSATGGGKGGQRQGICTTGGPGGGGAWVSNSTGCTGTNGGNGGAADSANGGGGGGSGGNGGGYVGTKGGNGGIGTSNSISGSAVYYGGGGGGGNSAGGAATGGTGGGGNAGSAGTNNLGGGGGCGAGGGSGVVIIKYLLTVAPTAPTIGTPTALSDTSIQWNFTDNASNEDGFKVYDTSNVLKATCATPNLSSCTETGLTANTSYTRKVVAYNTAGNSSYSSTATISTLDSPPAAPTIGTPTVLSDTSIKWYFTDNASNETGFKVYDTSNVIKATCAAPDRTSCTETGLTANTSYTRKVVAYNGTGNSSYSSTANATTWATSCQPLLSQSTHTITTNCSFANTVVDHAGGSRFLTGIFGGSSTDNTSSLTVANGVVLTVNANQTLFAGTIVLNSTASISRADGSIIELDKPVWLIDHDLDGFPSSNGGYDQTSAPTDGVRINSFSTVTFDCNDNAYSLANSCSNCNPGDTPSTVGSDLYGTTCKKCVTGVLTNQTSSEDLFSQCTTAAAGQANSCMGANCNGAGACSFIAAGEASQAVCKRCSGSSFDPVNITDNTQDAEGSNLCNQTCKNCNGAGSCVIQASNEDLFGQCASGNCATGNCNGTTAACQSSGTWTCNTCYTCCSAPTTQVLTSQTCTSGGGCNGCACGPITGTACVNDTQGTTCTCTYTYQNNACATSCNCSCQ